MLDAAILNLDLIEENPGYAGKLVGIEAEARTCSKQARARFSRRSKKNLTLISSPVEKRKRLFTHDILHPGVIRHLKLAPCLTPELSGSGPRTLMVF